MQVDVIVMLRGLAVRFDQIMASANTLPQGTRSTPLPIIISQYLTCSSQGSTTFMWTLEWNVMLWLHYCWTALRSGCDKGQKWNLTDFVLIFGTLVSTSSSYDGSGVVTMKWATCSSGPWPSKTDPGLC